MPLNKRMASNNQAEPGPQQPDTTNGAGDSTRSQSASTNVVAAAVATAAASDVRRSLIVDEAFFEEQFLRCQVCHERFDQSERAPKSLPCNHTFCLPCLRQIFDHAQPPNRRTLLWAEDTLDGALKCPTCRVEIILSRNKIKELPNDHRVVQMMDFLSQAVAKSQNACSKHERQPLNFFCKKCLVPVCRDCTVLDHKEADGHNIIDVSEALSENSTQFSDIENQSRETLQKMKSRSDSLANASKRLDILERSLKNEIKETFIEYRLLLEKRQEALTSMVQQICKDQKGMINSVFVNVCEKGTQLQKLYDDFKAARHSNDIRKLFTITQQMKDHENGFTEVATQDDSELLHSCEFEAQNEGSFLSDMSSLGEVRKKPDPGLKEQISAHQLMYLNMEEQRERQRYLDEHLRDYENCDETEFMGMGNSGELHVPVYDSDEERADEDGQADSMDSLPHIHYDDRVSRLISRYMRSFDDRGHENMDHDDVVPPAIRRNYQQNRRGRRSRDTNSSQVSTSMTMEPQANLDLLRAARAAATRNPGSDHSSSGSNDQRPGSGSSRSRITGSGGGNSASAVRVVRHLNGVRHGVRSDDSS